MSRPRRTLCALYLGIAVLALVCTWRQNLGFMADKGIDLPHAFAAFWPELFVSRPTTSITVDIFFFCLAGFTWMVLEARRLRIRFVWLYVLFSFLIAVSVMFPLFLFARERRLAALDRGATEPALHLADTIGLGLLTMLTFGLGIWSVLH